MATRSDASHVVAYGRVVLLQGAAALLAVLTQWQFSLWVDPYEFGQYMLYLAVINFGILVFMGWPNAALLRFGREEWQQRGRLGENLGTRVLLYVVMIAIALIAAGIAERFIARFMSLTTTPLPWVALGLAVVPLSDIGVYAHLATGRTTAYGFIPLLGRVPAFIGALVLAVVPWPASWQYLAACLAIGAALSGIVALRSLPRQAWEAFSPTVESVRKFMKYSWTIPMGAIAAYTVNWVDTFSLRAFLGPEAVGVYGWAYQLTAVGTLAFAALGVTVTPGLIDARSRQDASYMNRYWRRCLCLTVLFTLAVMAVLPLLAPVVELAIPTSYRPAYPVLVLLISASPFQLLSYLLNPILMTSTDLVGKVTLIGVAVALSNLVGDVLLIPWLGVTGPAAATLVALAIGAVLQMKLAGGALVAVRRTAWIALFTSALAAEAAIALLWLGPLWGMACSLTAAAAVVILARKARLVWPEDIGWLESQPLPRGVRWVVLRIAAWLAARPNHIGLSLG